MELECKIQNYDWGHLGKNSTVADLKSTADNNFKIDDARPYAEMWMGTHPNGASIIKERGITISEYIKDNLDAIGPEVRRMFGVSVPFLFKVLSIRKALSIQVHPTKEHAAKLHKLFPEVYKDPNHKPELAIALTPFEALCGFRPPTEIKDFLKEIPELVEILSRAAVNEFLANNIDENVSEIIKLLFHSLMECNSSVVSQSLLAFLNRISTEDTEVQSKLLYPLVKRLHSDYPGDVGCWAPYFLNYMVLRPGQAIYLKAQLPHAYLSGDCIECMACSDNVVRAGLTPKPKDVKTLIEMLDYSSYTHQDMLFNPELEDEYTCVWRPPVPDFAVAKIVVPCGESYNSIVRDGPSILLVTRGSGEICDTEPVTVRRGVAVFLKASRQATITPAEGESLEIYQAMCNL